MFKFFLNYQQHKIDISVNYSFSFVSFVKFIVVCWKMLLNLLLNYSTFSYFCLDFLSNSSN